MNRWFHPGFTTDLTDAARYYEAQRTGLGAEFLRDQSNPEFAAHRACVNELMAEIYPEGF